MSLHLQRQISKLKDMILAMGTLVEEAVAGAHPRHRVAGRAALAKQVIQKDTEIDLTELDVEEECLHTLALHQPVAFDLRYVVGVLMINNDLERIADLAVNIAEKVEFLIHARGFPLMRALRHAADDQDGAADAQGEPGRAGEYRSRRLALEGAADLDDTVDEIHRQMYYQRREAGDPSRPTPRTWSCW